MKSIFNGATVYRGQFLALVLTIMGWGCGGSGLRESGLVVQTPDPLLSLIFDSFERMNLLGPDESDEIFEYKGFIFNGNSGVAGVSTNSIAMEVCDETVMVPASDGTRALYFHGRSGISGGNCGCHNPWGHNL